jgi:hypothetical protein
MSVIRSLDSRSSRVPRLLAFMLIAGGLALAGIGLTAVAETTPTAQAQVATLATPPPGSETDPSPTPEPSAEDALLAYAACMREHGIETDDPQFDVNGNLVSKPAFKAALKPGDGDEAFAAAQASCGDHLVALKPALDPAQTAEQTEAALRFAACMRDRGLDWPDPAADGSRFAGSDMKIDKKSPEFQAAFEVCGRELAVEDTSGASQ